MRFIKTFMSKFGNVKENEDESETALREALENAVIHGNRENAEKQVHVACRCSMDGEVLITLRYEANGFDTSAVPDPTESRNRLQPCGRGLDLRRVRLELPTGSLNAYTRPIIDPRSTRAAVPRRHPAVQFA